jgi:hypothetical protein
MSDEGTGAQQQPTGEDAQVAMDTGIRDQRLIVSGWFASHADSGTRGPHVHLGTGDGRDPVLRTSQIPELVDALNLVGGRIDRMWETDGAEYPFPDAPDDNDPAVIRRRRIDHLTFFDRSGPTSRRSSRSCSGPKTVTTPRTPSLHFSGSTRWR